MNLLYPRHLSYLVNTDLVNPKRSNWILSLLHFVFGEIALFNLTYLVSLPRLLFFSDPDVIRVFKGQSLSLYTFISHFILSFVMDLSVVIPFRLIVENSTVSQKQGRDTRNIIEQNETALFSWDRSRKQTSLENMVQFPNKSNRPHGCKLFRRSEEQRIAKTTLRPKKRMKNALHHISVSR